MNTDKHILRFAKNNRTAARKAFCLIVICVSCSSGFSMAQRAALFLKKKEEGFKAGRSDFCKYFSLSLSLSNILDRAPRGDQSF
jgi:hypothetical protein